MKINAIYSAAWAVVHANESERAEEAQALCGSHGVTRYAISPTEAAMLERSGVLEQINLVCGTGLDFMERDTIPAAQIAAALEIVSEGGDFPALRRALEDALAQKACVTVWL